MDNMESSQLKLPPSPGAPLYPISPDRFNQQRMSESSRGSPELSPLHNKSGGRNTADVQSRVAYFTNLSRANSPGPGSSTTTAAALQRAILGREEAEAAFHATNEQLSEANARERRVSERLESLMEELQSLKERQAHERSIFEKEVRKARKEAFRAGSTLLKTQEELKYSRSQIKTLKEGQQAEKDAKDKATQEAFERAYALAGLTEELEAMREKLRHMETDNRSEALEVKADELQNQTPAKMTSTRSRSSTPAPRSLKRDKPDSVDQKSPTRKRVFNGQHIMSPKIESPVKLEPSPVRRSCLATIGSGRAYDEQAAVESLRSDLRLEKHLRSRAEDMVYFLKMECQFKRCSCRIAENRGVPYIHDYEWDMGYQALQQSKTISSNSRGSSECRATPTHDTIMPNAPEDTEAENLEQQQQQKQTENLSEGETQSTVEDQASVIMTFCPDTGTFQSIPSPAKESAAAQSQDGEAPLVNEPPRPPSRSPSVTPQPEHQPSGERESTMTDQRSIPIRQPTVQQSNPPVSIPVSTSAPENDNQSIPAQNPFMKETTPITQTATSTTQTVPLFTEKSDRDAFDPVSGTPISREEALAQIRARRGRTQNELKRSASANDASTRPRTAATPIRGPKRIPGVGHSGLRSRPTSGARRDISAPAGKY